MEQLARDKEAKYAEDRKNSERKAELFDLIKNIAEEESKVCANEAVHSVNNSRFD